MAITITLSSNPREGNGAAHIYDDGDPLTLGIAAPTGYALL